MMRYVAEQHMRRGPERSRQSSPWRNRRYARPPHHPGSGLAFVLAVAACSALGSAIGHTNPTLNVNGTRSETPDYTTDLLTDHAVEFIRRDHDRPFLLYLSHKAVHAPFTPAERRAGAYVDTRYPRPASMADTDANYAGKPAWMRAQRNSWHGVDGMYDGRTDFNRFVREYAEALMAVDDSVGRVVDALRDEGLLDSTLLVFTSDNGFQFGEHGLIVNIDFAPTFLEAASAPIPQAMQGRSFHGLLDGTAEEWRDAFLYEYFWELAFPQTPTVLGVRSDRYKLIRFHGVWEPYELYDLEADPHEMHNLLGDVQVETQAGTVDRQILQRAAPEVAEVFADLMERLTAILRETGALDEPTWRAAAIR